MPGLEEASRKSWTLIREHLLAAPCSRFGGPGTENRRRGAAWHNVVLTIPAPQQLYSIAGARGAGAKRVFDLRGGLLTMRSRGIRRHHEQRIKSRVRSYHGGFAAGDPRHIGKIAHARQQCSCRLCGNPRRYWKEETIQELRADMAAEA